MKGNHGATVKLSPCDLEVTGSCPGRNRLHHTRVCDPSQDTA